MKLTRKLLLLLTCLCLVAACAFVANAQADGEVVYTDTSESITITVYSSGLARYEGTGILYHNMFPAEPTVTRVEIGEGITEIGGSVFYCCTEIRSISFPNSLRCIGNYALYDCTGITFLDLNQVSYIGEGNMYYLGPNHKGPEEIIFSSNMESIPYGLCGGWENLKKVTIPEGIKTIEAEAFGGCSNLKSIFLPEGVKQIKDGAFRGCSSLESLVFPDSLEIIGDDVLYDCTGITYLDLNQVSYIGQGNTYQLGPDYKGPEEIIFSSKMESIPECFSEGWTNLKKVTIPEGIKTIGYKAFSGCTGLESITLPDSLETIDDFALYDCTGITFLDLNQVSHVGEGNMYCLGPDHKGPDEIIFSAKMERITYRFCDGWENLKKVTIPEGIVRIEGEAFSRCSNLKTIHLPEGLKRIENEAFASCSSLESITFPDSLHTIGDRVLTGCTGITVLDLNQLYSVGEGNIYGIGPDGNGPEEIIFPANWESIPERFCGGCENLKKVTMPESVKIIEEDAFGGCINLKSIDIPEGITTIESNAFFGCTGLESITFPDSLVTLGDSVLYGCTGITVLDLNQISDIGEGSLFGVGPKEQGLEKIIFSPNMESIPFRFCAGWKNLKEAILPKGVKTIEQEAFSDCSNLKSVILSEGFEKIGHSAFRGSGIQTISLPSSLRTIDTFAFYECKNLSSIDLPEGLVNIGSGAFYDSGLISITIPDSVTSLAYEVPFGGGSLGTFACPNLTEVKLGNGFTDIPWGCFDGTALKSIEIPESVTRIDAYAFCDCKELTSVTIPASVEYIGEYAFVVTSSLTNAIFLGNAPQMHSPFYCASFNGVAFYPKGNPTWEKDIGNVLWQSGGLLAAIPYTVDIQGNIIPEAPSAVEVTDAISRFAIDTYPAGSGYPANFSYILNGNMLQVQGAEAFAFELSDACFGYLPISQKRSVSYSALKVGDILYAGSDIWVITKKTSSGVELAGVQNGRVCYGVAMTKAQVQAADAYRTRVGVSPYPGEVDPAQNNGTINGPGRVLTEAEVYETLIALKPHFPQGMPYSSKNHHHGNVSWDYLDYGIASQDGHGCSAFAYYFSDTAFGHLPARYVDVDFVDFDSIMVGDLLLTATHEVVVLEVYSDRVIVTEANYNERVHWGRSITRQEIERECALVTRYPEGTKPAARTAFKCTHKYTDNGWPTADGVVYTCNSCGYSYTESAPTELKITTQPKTTYTKSGATAKVTVKAQGDGLTYQWYIKNAGGSKYSKSSVTSATYSAKMSSTTKDRYAYCVITDAYGNSVQTKTVRLRMAASITTQPKNVEVAEGKTAKVTVKAAGDGLTYKWYVKNPGASKFSLSKSFAGNYYSVKMDESRDGRQVYCVVTDKYGKTVKSNVVTLSMEPIEIVLQPTNAAAAKNKTVGVFVMAKGEDLKYQWYVAAPGSSKFSKSSVTDPYYSVAMTAARDGRKVYCLITDGDGNSVKTKTVTLTMDNTIGTALKIKTQPVNATAASGKKVSTKVTATGEGLKYQWFVLSVGAEDYAKSSNTKNTYSTTMNSSRNGNLVFCVITDSHGNTVVTNTVTLRMK